MRTCLSCEYCKEEGRYFFCHRPSLVTGDPQENIRQKCVDERTNLALCGPDARFWEKAIPLEKIQ